MELGFHTIGIIIISNCKNFPDDLHFLCVRFSKRDAAGSVDKEEENWCGRLPFDHCVSDKVGSTLEGQRGEISSWLLKIQANKI